MSAPENNTGIRRFVNAFTFSMQGLKACFKSEEAFRHEVYLAALMIPAAFWIGGSAVEIVLLVMSVAIVLIVEMLNTAVERAVDRISLDKHELSKEAKDMGSAAVFMALVLAGVVWAVICLPKIL
ncbi:MAG: diacylglycerol kinase [Alphaproteobacteria bacterium]|nr:diacylglycerol kinase [Alphaproteobacteria bacterium]